MNEIKRELLPAIGAELAGGFYTGIIQTEGQLFALITAPKELELTGEWGAYGTEVEGAKSQNNCPANTIAMAEAGSELAQKVVLIKHAGFNDWAIPSIDALEMMYRAFKPSTEENFCSFRDGNNPSSIPPGFLYTETTPSQTGAAQFKSGDQQAFFGQAIGGSWYWSSTQYRASYACSQDFSDGGQDNYSKNYTARVRPVRRLLIS
jgi:hypothetical protein